MTTKIYTATIVVEDITGKTSIGDNMYCASYATEEEIDKWVDETYLDIVRERDANDEGHTWSCHIHTEEREIIIPVFVMVNADYRDNDDNCGIVTAAFGTKQEAINLLKASIAEEIEAGSIDKDEIDWHTHNGKRGIANMPTSPEIADTNRFGWTIDEL